MRGYINIIHTNLGTSKETFIIRSSAITMPEENENSIYQLQLNILYTFLL